MDNSLSNFLNIIKIKQNQKIRNIAFKKTKKRVMISDLLYKLGFLSSLKIIKNKIIIGLKYHKGKVGAIRDIVLISKPSNKIYGKIKNIKKFHRNNIYNNSNGFFIFSTNKGIITENEATLLNTGGEILFKIW